MSKMVVSKRTRRVSLIARGDNVAYSLCRVKLQPHFLKLTIFAREMAVDIADAAYQPDIVEHVSGDSNDMADWFSRQGLNQECDHASLIGFVLRYASRVLVPLRPKEW